VLQIPISKLSTANPKETMSSREERRGKAERRERKREWLLHILPSFPINGQDPKLITTSVACAVGLTDFSFQNLVFWSLFQFSAAEIT
jgi:hypothetical protein